ncbi:hypothetical protein [Pseudoalteromonas rubra]|uniref:hypothetical protein n=1 Tax=Pseudoalteromonas rubra TaxID=43658 RepID=UPI00026CC64F|nr:hypothetical protein [Pseudoalteromonas rubra]
MKNYIVVAALVLLLSACSATRELASTIDKNYKFETAKLIFYSPNFSAVHMPPLMNSYAYVDTYEFDDFCSSAPKAISTSSVNKDTRTQESLLPTGKVVAHIGYNATGAGGLTGESFYIMNIKPNEQYKITLTEARPLVTSYSVEIKLLKEGRFSPVEAVNYNRKRDVCK